MLDLILYIFNCFSFLCYGGLAMFWGFQNWAAYSSGVGGRWLIMGLLLWINRNHTVSQPLSSPLHRIPLIHVMDGAHNSSVLWEERVRRVSLLFESRGFSSGLMILISSVSHVYSVRTANKPRVVNSRVHSSLIWTFHNLGDILN